MAGPLRGRWELMWHLRGLSARAYLLSAVVVVAVAAAAFIEPIPQDAGYHRFADTRQFWSIPNFWNVATNAPFVLAGIAGLVYLRVTSRGLIAELRPAYSAFYLGILLTGFGSAWYHLAPDNQTLILDRLPMTLAFMGLFSIIFGEYVSANRARKLLLPLLVLGTASVLYWALTETRGNGDLRPYALVQFLPMVLIPLILLMYSSPFDRTSVFWWAIAIYIMSKLLEHFDHEVFAASGSISGHSLKHVVAGLVPFVLLFGFATRKAHDQTGSTRCSR